MWYNNVKKTKKQKSKLSSPRKRGSRIFLSMTGFLIKSGMTNRNVFLIYCFIVYFMSKRSKIKIIIYSVLLIIILAFLVWWFSYNSTQARDYQRLGDMRVLEAALNSYFFRFNTYQIPECGPGSVINFCTGRGERTIEVAEIIDPVNLDNLRYVVADLTADNFRVEFYLEGSLAGLPSGRYALTREGLGR